MDKIIKVTKIPVSIANQLRDLGFIIKIISSKLIKDKK